MEKAFLNSEYPPSLLSVVPHTIEPFNASLEGRGRGHRGGKRAGTTEL